MEVADNVSTSNYWHPQFSSSSDTVEMFVRFYICAWAVIKFSRVQGMILNQNERL